MRFRFPTRRSALTLIEVLLIVGIVMLGIAFAVPLLLRPHTRMARSSRVQCINNLKQVGISFQIWAGDNAGKFPMQLSTNARGSKEFEAGPFAFQHFRAMSLELNSPRVLFCPEEVDRWRSMATAFRTSGVPGEVRFESNTNLSYFVGVAADTFYPQSILTGDHHLTNGTPVIDHLLDLRTNFPTGWTHEMHSSQGNVAMADGSVQTFTSARVRDALKYTGMATNRLQMP